MEDVFFIHSFIHSLTHSFIHSLIHSLTHSFIHSLIRSFIHAFIHSLIHSPFVASIHRTWNEAKKKKRLETDGCVRREEILSFTFSSRPRLPLSIANDPHQQFKLFTTRTQLQVIVDGIGSIESRLKIS